MARPGRRWPWRCHADGARGGSTGDSGRGRCPERTAQVGVRAARDRGVPVLVAGREPFLARRDPRRTGAKEGERTGPGRHGDAEPAADGEQPPDSRRGPDAQPVRQDAGPAHAVLGRDPARSARPDREGPRRPPPPGLRPGQALQPARTRPTPAGGPAVQTGTGGPPARHGPAGGARAVDLAGPPQRAPVRAVSRAVRRHARRRAARRAQPDPRPGSAGRLPRRCTRRPAGGFRHAARTGRRTPVVRHGRGLGGVPRRPRQAAHCPAPSHRARRPLMPAAYEVAITLPARDGASPPAGEARTEGAEQTGAAR